MEIVCALCEVESEISYFFEMFHSRVMIHAVDRQPLISAVRVQSQGSTVRLVVDKVALGRTSPNTSILPR